MIWIEDGDGVNYFVFYIKEGFKNFFYKEVGDLIVCVWKVFINVDGNDGCDVCLKFYVIVGNVRISYEVVKEIDKFLCCDCLNQVKDQLSMDEMVFIEFFIFYCGGGFFEDMVFLEFFCCQVLQGWGFDNF